MNIEEIQITKYKVGDRIFDSKEEAERYADKDMKTEERLKELSIDENIEIPWLLYDNLADGVLVKADSGFKLFIAHNKSDLNFLYSWSRPNPFLTGFVTRKTPCIVAINKFRNMFITVDALIEKGEKLSKEYQQYDDELAKMEKQIAELEQKLGV
jgi:hypothetical protein